MGDKSPKSKQKDQAQKRHKEEAAGQAKQSRINAQRQPPGGPPKKK